MKSATIALALLVAVFLFAPASASAAPLPVTQRAGQLSVLELETDALPGAEVDAASEVEGEDTSGIVDLRATAARLRGRVELDWRIEEAGSEGLFVVERSTNGSSWRPVKACTQPLDENETDFGCTDSRLTSGTTYAYRVCITTKGTTCSNASPSHPVTVKAP